MTRREHTCAADNKWVGARRRAKIQIKLSTQLESAAAAAGRSRRADTHYSRSVSRVGNYISINVRTQQASPAGVLPFLTRTPRRRALMQL
jgi:hypothetical protein